MNNPLVSICVPIYGVEQYIEKCAKSLFEQTYNNIEFIFVNDNTKDNSIKILESTIKNYSNLKEQIKIINHSVNLGLSQARETAIQTAKGKYIYHIDSDDYIEKDTIENCVRTAEKESSDIVITGMINEFKNKSYIYTPPAKYSHKEFLQQVIRKSIPAWLAGKLIKRELYTNNNIHNIPNVNFAEDYATLPRLLFYAKKISILEMPLYHYIRYNENSYTIKYKKKNVDNIITAHKVLLDFFEGQEEYSKDLMIAKLKIQAWIIHYTISYSTEENLIEKSINSIEYNKELFKDLSINHNIILTLSYLQLKKLLIIYIKSTRRIYSLIRPFLKRN